ncbi:hypothetical protein JCM3765_001732 [Sporobolomyces pararoseus]
MSNPDPRTQPRPGGFDPSRKLDWTAKTQVSSVKKLVQEREELFTRHRKVFDPTLATQCLSRAADFIARDRSVAPSFDRYKDWCDAVQIPHFPISISSITLFLVCKIAHKDGWYKTVKSQLYRLRNDTTGLWKNVEAYSDLEDEVKAAAALNALMLEKRKAFEGKKETKKDKKIIGYVSDTEDNDSSSNSYSSSDSASDSDSDSDSDSESSEAASSKPLSKRVKGTRRSSGAHSVGSSIGQVRQLNVPNLPRDGDRFSSANDLLVACYRALLPIYGNGANLVEYEDNTVEIGCGRSNSAYAKSEAGCCGWKLRASLDSSTGEIVVRQASSHLYHNHGQSKKLAAHPNWRPTIINPVVREAFGLEQLTARRGKQRRRSTSTEDELPAKKRQVSDSTNSATQAYPHSSPHPTPVSHTPSASSMLSNPPVQPSQCYTPNTTSSSSSAAVDSPFRPQLESFLKGLHPSLSALTLPLLTAGINSIDTLTLLCLLDSSTLAKFMNSIQEKARISNQTISVIQIKLFEKSVREAQHNSPTPSPEPEVSASPAATPFSPTASASNARRSASAGQNSQSPQVESNEATRLARLQAELESLRRQERIAALQREIDGLQGEVESNGGGASSSSARKIKAEPSDSQRDAKKVKQEIGEASLSQSKGGSKGKGKEKKKAEVIVLSDSD